MKIKLYRLMLLPPLAIVTIFSGLLGNKIFPQFGNQLVISAKQHEIAVTPVVTKLNHPWAALWLPNPNNKKQSGMVLISERNGDLVLADSKTGKITKLTLPLTIKPYRGGQGGLLDLAIAPDYAKSGWIYLTLSVQKTGGSTTALTRFRIQNNNIVNFELLFEARPVVNVGIHFGSRIVFPKIDDSSADDVLYLSVGERGQRNTVQRMDNHIGKVIRFNYRSSFTPEVYSTGHRNQQGMVWDTLGKQLLLNEHGAKGGDEVNIVKQGKNYGWPVISYGENYNGTKIGIGTSKAGMEQPMYYWDPSIAPSGMIVYKGSEFEKWNGNLLLGSLKFGLLIRLELSKERNQVVSEERILSGRLGRIRHVSQDLEGNLYVLTDSPRGVLYRLARLAKN